MTKVLYIRPPAKSESGVRAYSDVVLSALRKYCFDSLEVIDFAVDCDLIPTLCKSFDERYLVHRVKELIASGYFSSFDLFFAEIGLSEFVEFYVLTEIKKQLPQVPSLVTMHDPPRTVINLKPRFSLYQDHVTVRAVRKLYNIIRGSDLESRLFSQSHSYIVLSRKAKSDLMLKLRSLNFLFPVYYLPHINYFEAPGTKHDKTGKEIRIGYFGYISRSKGIDILLQAVKRLKRQINYGSLCCKFIIAGGCLGKNNISYLHELYQYVKHNQLEDIVEFTGFIPNEKIPDFIRQLDVMVLPYRKTNSASASGPMMWARSFGIPVIASRTRNFPELILHGGDGFLFEPNDTDALYKQILDLIENPGLLARLGSNARAVSHVTRWEKTANDIISIINRIRTTKKKLVAIDGRVFMSAPTGIANYLINALSEMSRQLPEWDFLILTNRDINTECLDRLPNAENILHLKKPFTNIGIVWYSTKLFYILQDLKPDYFWAPANSLPPSVPAGIKTILTIHDLVAKDFRHTMSTFNRIYNDRYFDKSIKNADIIWAVSRYTRDEIEQRYPARRCKDIFVGSGVDRNIFKPIEISDHERQELLKRVGVGDKFLLYVGTVEPRKNVVFLLSLMPILARAGYCLLIVGAKGWGKHGINEILDSPSFPRERIVLSGFLETGDLVKIYNCASVFVSTSLNEGFGLPQLEAMNCGCPVVCSHNSAMIEIVNDAGRTVKGWNADDWCSTILDVANSKEEYIRRGFEKAALFDWRELVTNFIKRVEPI